MPSTAARGRSTRAPRDGRQRSFPMLLAATRATLLVWASVWVFVVHVSGGVCKEVLSWDWLWVRWRLYSLYGSRMIPAVASAMPLTVENDADMMAVSGPQRRVSMVIGVVSCLVIHSISQSIPQLYQSLIDLPLQMLCLQAPTMS